MKSYRIELPITLSQFFIQYEGRDSLTAFIRNLNVTLISDRKKVITH